MCKSHEKVSMHAMAVKHGGKFIDTFLKAFNFLERHFKQHNDTIVKMLKQLQKGTRIIQSICSDAKGNKRTMITSKVPPRRDPWSDSCFRSRRCYTAAPPRRNSRWHKYLQGHVVSSQAYGNVDEEDEEQTEIDSDLPADEHDNGNAMEEDVVEGSNETPMEDEEE
ncbi:uncharacterized protein [Zea mays]|uniref:uncharacterized protein n=1 Tax=Zea mays TaxID=4577 RepID=UPI001652AF49|nr:uncharacterized protein LOC111589926 [Zea mays]